ncbi:MAG: XylR family transcriptional regulator [Planctomycetota bacterium]|nr:MAG: XylR family transcriptional regulator [Planctomycetota bacterium]
MKIRAKTRSAGAGAGHGRLRVALDIETSRNYGRRILMGVSKYLVTHRRWSIYVEQHEIGSGVRQLLSRWKGHGIITRQATPDCVALLRRRGLPAVDLSNFMPHLGIPRINSADLDIGVMAAKHFLERGFRHFGCCGFVDQFWSQRRRAAFAEAVEAAGGDCSVLEQPFRTRAQLWDRDQSRLVAWLKQLPKPVAVFATNDLLGHHVLDACGGEMSVPEQVAVLGVDDDELLCGLCDPPLSSINPDPERIGYEAATWLDRMMQGESSPSDAFLEIPPQGIVVRQSSDIFAVPDEDFATALRFIREHACDGITVEDVAAHVAVSRSWLERHFRAHLGRSPQAEIRSVQIKRCQELLRNTDLPLRTISRLAGFKHIEYMSVVFKRVTGESPGRYRSLKL